MKKQSLFISIPEPCHEKWSEMTAVEKGRHCLSCQKTVVDFTRMPKVKIAEYVSEHQGKMCGRFTSDQLNVELIPPKPTKSWLKYAAIILGLVPTVGYGQEVANKNNPIPTHISNELKIGEFVQEDIPKKGKINVDTTSIQAQVQILSGTVVDDATGEPILFGSVTLYKGDKIITGVQTDIDGRFTIEVSIGDVIEASYTGYEPYKIKVGETTFEKDLIMRLKENFLFGDVVVVGMYVPSKIEDKKGTDDNSRESKTLQKIKPIEISEVQSIANETKVNYDGKNVVTGLVSSTKIAEHEIQSSESNLGIANVKGIKPILINQYTNQILVYPNPTTGMVTITIPNEINAFNLNVSNMNNEIVFSNRYEINPNTLDLSSLVPGSYIISIIHQDKLIYSGMVIKI